MRLIEIMVVVTTIFLNGCGVDPNTSQTSSGSEITSGKKDKPSTNSSCRGFIFRRCNYQESNNYLPTTPSITTTTYSIGGYFNSTESDIILASTNGQTWTSHGQLPTTLVEGSVFQWDGNVYVLGGFMNGMQNLDVYKSNDLKTWVTEPSISSANNHGAQVGNTFVLVGSNLQGNSQNVQRCTFSSTLNCTDLGDLLPEPLYRPAIVNFNNELYIIGGRNYNTNLNTTKVLKSSNLGSSWTEVGNLPVALESPSVIVNNNKLYVMGGFDDAGVATNYNFFTTNGVNWVQTTNLHKAAALFGLINFGVNIVGLHDSFFAFDGSTFDEDTSNNPQIHGSVFVQK